MQSTASTIDVKSRWNRAGFRVCCGTVHPGGQSCAAALATQTRSDGRLVWERGLVGQYLDGTGMIQAGAYVMRPARVRCHTCLNWQVVPPDATEAI
jgi:hypothetical protein